MDCALGRGFHQSTPQQATRDHRRLRGRRRGGARASSPTTTRTSGRRAIELKAGRACPPQELRQGRDLVRSRTITSHVRESPRAHARAATSWTGDHDIGATTWGGARPAEGPSRATTVPVNFLARASRPAEQRRFTKRERRREVTCSSDGTRARREKSPSARLAPRDARRLPSRAPALRPGGGLVTASGPRRSRSARSARP